MKIHLIERGIGKVCLFIINIDNIELLSILIGHAKDIINIELLSIFPFGTKSSCTMSCKGYCQYSTIVNIPLLNENPFEP
jgi:hypothetical protein